MAFSAPYQYRLLLWLVLLGVAAMAACRQEASPTQYVARLGNEYLMEDELRAAIANLPPTMDSVAVRQQVIDQWINNRLLVREARRRNLQLKEDVIKLLQENERSVLISALVEDLYDETSITITPEELEAEYNAYKEQLRLRYSYVRVRYLKAADSLQAERARQALLQVMQSNTVDSLWTRIVDRYAIADKEVSLALVETFHPERQLFPTAPVLNQRLGQMGPGETAPVLAAGGAYHLLQLVDRVPPGTIPERAWIEPELRQRLTVRRRKELYDGTLRQLYNRALSNNLLDIR